MRIKKALSVLLLGLLLCACVPTPEEEVVVNKGDGTFEELIKVTAEPQPTAATPGETAEAPQTDCNHFLFFRMKNTEVGALCLCRVSSVMIY